MAIRTPIAAAMKIRSTIIDKYKKYQEKYKLYIDLPNFR